MRERGSASVELVLLTPLLLVMLVFVVFLGRLGQARNDVDRAARDAARAASLARSPSDADAAGVGAARDTLQSGGITCGEFDVVVDTSRFAAGGDVAATVSCTLNLADVVELKLPGSQRLTATFSEPVDAFRGVRP